MVATDNPPVRAQIRPGVTGHPPGERSEYSPADAERYHATRTIVKVGAQVLFHVEVELVA
jgi:hypothetical protein